ncbi:MAG: hypothetical protein SOR93_06470 [Clostridiales Family XIII bacterium]|nr:hypothetical protein [Clostridia bacterium]MDY3010898.1 hypothetical protein [Clostridiales Family XIII bacterium]
MKIVGQNQGVVMESNGFFIKRETRGFVIVDVGTNIALGKYTTPARTQAVFDEMICNFTNQSKACYHMPQE